MAEAMARHFFPQLASKADLGNAVRERRGEIAKLSSDLSLRLIVRMIAVAGLALTIAKLL